MCLSPDGRQLGLCGGQYAFMSQSKHLLALIIQLGEEEEEDCGTSTALSPDRVSQAWGADMAHSQQEMACRSGDTCSPRLGPCHVPFPMPPTHEIKVEEPKAQSVDLFSSPYTLEWMPSVYVANAHIFLYPVLFQTRILTASGHFHVESLKHLRHNSRKQSL